MRSKSAAAGKSLPVRKTTKNISTSKQGNDAGSKPTPKKPSAKSNVQTARKSAGDVTDRLQQALAMLEKNSSPSVRDGMKRFGIPNDKAIGVAVGDIRTIGKSFKKDHELALALWRTGKYEARMLACFVDDPAQVTAQQMTDWADEFDSWAICDTACFALFDRSADAWKMVDRWAKRHDEFVKRAAFAMLAGLSIHQKKADDAEFADRLILIERAADDDRNFVKKGVSWALRSVGKRSPLLHSAAIALAEKLANSSSKSERWVGNDAKRDLASPASIKRLHKQKTR